MTELVELQALAHLGQYQKEVDAALGSYRPVRFDIDFSMTAKVLRENLHRLEELTEACCADRYTHALVLGMGGGSLYARIYPPAFRGAERRPRLNVAAFHSTDPTAVLGVTKRLDPAHTLFVVVSKGGSTLETICLFKFFYNWVAEAVGPEKAGDHFIAITKPGSMLDGLAKEHQFRTAFYEGPGIGGHSAALSYTGLVPAALAGIDVSRLLDAGLSMERLCTPDVPTERNVALWLGVILSQLHNAGRDKATLLPSEPVAPVLAQIDDLLAESTGKDGRGILPVSGEPLGSAEVYGNDRLFIRLKLAGPDHARTSGQETDQALAALQAAGHPVVHLPLRDRYDVAAQCVLWRWAAALATHLNGDPNPFVPPFIGAFKALERELVEQYTSRGTMPEAEAPAFTADGIAVYGDTPASSPAEALRSFLSQGRAGSYIGLQAWIPPTEEAVATLQMLRTKLRDEYRLATMAGFGPSYAHTQGQIQKGDAGNGLFVQFTADDGCDVAIPDVAGEPGSSITFGRLKQLQFQAELQLLRRTQRRVIRFHLGAEASGSLATFTNSLS